MARVYVKCLRVLYYSGSLTWIRKMMFFVCKISLVKYGVILGTVSMFNFRMVLSIKKQLLLIIQTTMNSRQIG